MVCFFLLNKKFNGALSYWSIFYRFIFHQFNWRNNGKNDWFWIWNMKYIQYILNDPVITDNWKLIPDSENLSCLNMGQSVFIQVKQPRFLISAHSTLRHNLSIFCIFLSYKNASYARYECFSLTEKHISSCTSAAQWYSDYWECVSVSVTTRKKQNKAFPARERGKGSAYYWLSTWLDWNRGELDWKLCPSWSINLKSSIECYEALFLWIDSNLAVEACHDDNAIFNYW